MERQWKRSILGRGSPPLLSLLLQWDHLFRSHPPSSPSSSNGTTPSALLPPPSAATDINLPTLVSRMKILRAFPPAGLSHTLPNLSLRCPGFGAWQRVCRSSRPTTSICRTESCLAGCRGKRLSPRSPRRARNIGPRGLFAHIGAPGGASSSRWPVATSLPDMAG